MTTLTTDRLVLRPLETADAGAIAAQINDYEVSKNLSRVPFPYTLADAHEFLGWVETLDARSLFVAISEKHGPGTLIGVMSLEYAEAKDNAELGYWLAQPYWNKGYMRETVRAVVDHAFGKTPLNLMVSCYFNANPNSGKVLRGVGFEDAGQCMGFSKAQGIEVPVSNMRLRRDRWAQMKDRRAGGPDRVSPENQKTRLT